MAQNAITPFEGAEAVSRTNFNRRIDEMNIGLQSLNGRFDELGETVIFTAVLLVTAWKKEEITQVYRQSLLVEGLTERSKADFDADILTATGLPAPIYPTNRDGVLYAETLVPPEKDVTIQVTVSRTGKPAGIAGTVRVSPNMTLVFEKE